jgi:hypothetical protein
MEDSTTRIYTRWKVLLRVMKEGVVPDKAGSFEGWLKERKKDGDGGETGGENSGWENEWCLCGGSPVFKSWSELLESFPMRVKGRSGFRRTRAHRAPWRTCRVKRRRRGSGVTNPSLATIIPSRFLSGLTATGKTKQRHIRGLFLVARSLRKSENLLKLNATERPASLGL